VACNYGNAGSYASLEVVNGNPAVSFYDASLMILKYVARDRRQRGRLG